jgi:hypothetical protein
MTDSNSNITNVTTLSRTLPRKARTAAERKRASRLKAKEKAAALAVTAATVTPLDVAPSVTPAQGVSDRPGRSETGEAAGHAKPGPTVTAATLLAALALAACSAAFSISGLTTIFAGAVWPVIAMGVTFEIGKLSGVAWLGRSRHAPVTLRLAVAALIAVLIALNSAGVFGFLSRAHLSRVTDEIAVAHRAARVEGDIVVQGEIVSDLDRRISQIDAIIGGATARGKMQSALAIIADQSRTRADLVGQRQSASQKLAGMKVSRTAVAGEGRQVDADLGPVKYLAAVIGAADDQTLRGLILIVSLLLDPAAVLLMLAATYRRRAAP